MVEPFLKASENKVRYFTTDCSPSHLFGNITISDKYVLYIHNSEIQPRIIVVDKKLIHDSNSNVTNCVGKLNSTETNEMLAVKCVLLNGNYYVAVGLYGGFKLWSIDGNRLLFQIPTKVKLTSKPYAFVAIGSYKANPKGSGFDSIICGDNYGQLFLVNGSGSNWRAKLLYSYDGITITQVASGLTCDIIASSYETGEIYLNRIINDNEVELVAKMANELSLPCLSLCVIENTSATSKAYLTAGYLNGEIRIFNLTNNGQFVASIGAHLRMINQLVAYKNYFASCADDGYLNLWKIDSEEMISIEGTYELEDKMPVGVVFDVNNDGSVNIYSSIFDNTSLISIDNLNI